MTDDDDDALLTTIEPGDLDAAMRVVDTLLDAHDGQLTTSVRHMLGRLSGAVDFNEAALERRAAWYQARGRPIPPLPSWPVWE